MKRTWLRRLGVIALVTVAVAAAVFVIWAYDTPEPMPEALAALQSNPQVAVDTSRWLVFTPRTAPSTAGLILYPGGKVDPRSYAPPAQAIAAAGYTVVIVPMPLNLAVLGAGRAADVIAAYPQITRWAIGGHSLGGAMAANFARSHAGAVSGLVLWAAYPAGADDLSGLPLVVASIYGEADGVATAAQVLAGRPLLPQNTRWVAIAGGNHAQFGWYGEQAGDNPATITREQQQAQVVAATTELLRTLP